jgi:hypothetical protein
MIRRISAWVMWEYSALPWHVGQVFPACTFSIGPLRKANATRAFASRATRDEFCGTVLDFFIRGIVKGRAHVSPLLGDMRIHAEAYVICPLPSPRLQHLRFVQPRHGQSLHRALQVFADFK